MNPYDACDRGELAELSRWRIGARPAPAWLASRPDPRQARAKLILALRRPDRGGAWGRALARYLSADLDAVYAAVYPRKAAELAATARTRGEDAYADKLQTLLVAMGHCANCGHLLADPLSLSRGIGSDCWPRIDPAWRAAIRQRRAEDPGVRAREVGRDRQLVPAEADR